MKLRLIIVAALLSFIGAQTINAQTAMQNPLARQRESLNGVWNVLPDPFGHGVKNNWGAPKGDNERKLAEVYYDGDLTFNVPGDWNHQIPEFFYYEGDMWYQRTINYSPREGKRAILHFAAVSAHCSVYLNGEKIGDHRGAFTPFQFEVGDKLHEGVNNLIVRVDNHRSLTSIPATTFDWWNYGGVTRDVDLIFVPEEYIFDYTVGLDNNQKNVVAFEVQLSGADVANKKVTLSIPKKRFKLDVVTDENGVARATKRVKLDLWSPSSPKLYDVVVSSEEDSVQDRVGFRTIEVEGEQILLNGEPIFLRGINIHEEIAHEMRRSYNTEDAEALIAEAEALNCNFIRLSHYPHNEYMVRLAEERGFLMWEEIPVWQGICFSDKNVCEYAEDMMAEMIHRDKNRCGIILWSVSNETPLTEDRLECLAHLAKKSREWDSTRLITSALDKAKVTKDKEDGKFYMELPDPLIEHLDVVGINKYMGWYAHFPCDPAELNWRIATGKPVIMSEFGAECVAGNNEGDTSNLNLWTEDYMESVYEGNIASFENFPNLCGTSPWILYDFRSPRRPHAKFQRGWNRKGLISPEGVRKKAWYVMHDYYESKIKLAK